MSLLCAIFSNNRYKTYKARNAGHCINEIWGKKLTMKHCMKTTVNQELVGRWHIHVLNKSNKTLNTFNLN